MFYINIHIDGVMEVIPASVIGHLVSLMRETKLGVSLSLQAYQNVCWIIYDY